MLILKEKCLVLWNIAPLAAERILEIACNTTIHIHACAILEPVQEPQTLSTARVWHVSILVHWSPLPGVNTHHLWPPIKIWQILQYSEVCCWCTLNYICTNSNLNLEDDGAGFIFTVTSDYIKPQRHYYNNYNSILDFTPLMPFGLYSPTFITHVHKRAKNGLGFIIEWLTVAHLTCMWDWHLRTCKTGSCQKMWQDSRLNSEWQRGPLC